MIDDRSQAEASSDDFEPTARHTLVVDDLERRENHAMHAALDVERGTALRVAERTVQAAKQRLGLPERPAERILHVTTDRGDELRALMRPPRGGERPAEPPGGDLQDLRFVAGIVRRSHARGEESDAARGLEEHAAGDPRPALTAALAHDAPVGGQPGERLCG